MDVVKSIATPVMKVINENKDTIKSGIDAVGHIAKISDSTATIVRELMKRKKEKLNENNTSSVRLQNIVDKINAIKLGSGFVYA